MESGSRRFNLVREIGRGSFGAVFLAEMVSTGGFRKEVALKILREDTEGDNDAARRLRDEARLLGHLRHRNIVQVDDLIHLDGRWAVVMEYVPGHDLVAVLAALNQCGAELPLAAALEITGCVADALDAAFNERTADGSPLRAVHRDIKPSNVRITATGEVKVLDFGIAWANFEDREAKTGTVRFGSLPYMAPERMLGGPDLPEGDVYSLGCVLYEMLVKSRLGRAELAEAEHLGQKMRAQEAVRMRRGHEVEGLDALLGEMLAYDPDERPSAGRVARRCREMRRGLVDSEDLATFARHFVPQVVRWVEAEGRPARGLMAESSARAIPVLPPSNRRGWRAWILPALSGLLGATVAAAGLSIFVQDTLQDRATAGVAAAGVPGLSAAEGAALPPASDTGRLANDSAAPSKAELDQELVEAPEDGDDAPPELAVVYGGAVPAPLEEADEAPDVASDRIVPAGLDGPPERLRAVKFSAPTASRLAATCGDRASRGTMTVLLRGLPAGSCEVSALIDGAEYTATVPVYAATALSCGLEEETLVCR